MQLLLLSSRTKSKTVRIYIYFFLNSYYFLLLIFDNDYSLQSMQVQELVTGLNIACYFIVATDTCSCVTVTVLASQQKSLLPEVIC